MDFVTPPFGPVPPIHFKLIGHHNPEDKPVTTVNRDAEPATCEMRRAQEYDVEGAERRERAEYEARKAAEKRYPEPANYPDPTGYFAACVNYQGPRA
jgi:hypothetical protein